MSLTGEIKQIVSSKLLCRHSGEQLKVLINLSAQQMQMNVYQHLITLTELTQREAHPIPEVQELQYKITQTDYTSKHTTKPPY